jgi:hypothetical protein
VVERAIISVEVCKSPCDEGVSVTSYPFSGQIKAHFLAPSDKSSEIRK